MSANARTQSEPVTKRQRYSRYEVLGKSKNFDYCFRPLKEIENGHDGLGYEIVNGEDGEQWATPGGAGKKKTGSKKNGPLYLFDTVLCKRNKSISREFKIEEDEKYNAQMRVVREHARNARVSLRTIAENVGADSSIKDETETTFDTTERKTE